MPKGSETPVILGPFVGVDERATGDRNHVRWAWNMDFHPVKGMVPRPPLVNVGAFEGFNGGGPIRGMLPFVRADGSAGMLSIYRDNTFVDKAVVTYGIPLSLAASGGVSGDFGYQASGVYQGVPYGTKLIVIAPDRYLWVFDPTVATLKRLTAMQGDDVLRGLTGAETYRAAPPRATCGTVWRQRLVVGDGTVVALSAVDGDLAVVPANAPVGGANVWPTRTWKDVSADFGDEVMALAVVQDRLLVMGAKTIAIMDEDSNEPVARTISSAYGVLAKQSVQDIGDEVFYLSEGAICKATASSVEVISHRIPATLERVNWSAAVDAVSQHSLARKEYRVWLPLIGGQQVCAVYNYLYGEWRFFGGGRGPDGDYSDAPGLTPRVMVAASWRPPGGGETLVLGMDSPNGVDGEIWIEGGGAARDAWRGVVQDGEVGGGNYLPPGGPPGAGWMWEDVPALAVLPPVGNGTRRIEIGDVRLNMQWDGMGVGVKLMEGMSLEDGLSMVADSDQQALRPPAEQPRALTFAYDSLNPVRSFTYDHFRLPLAAAGTEVSILLSLWEPSGCECRGGVRWVEVEVDVKEGAAN